jgi:AraC family transcriptional regulator
MVPSPPLPELVPRVSADGSMRGLADEPGVRTVFAASWDGLRATQLHLEPADITEGYLVNHLVALNLGGETVCESRVEGRDWERHAAPHHGVSVIPARVPYAARTMEGGDYLLVEAEPQFVEEVLARDSFAEHVLLALADEGRRGAGSTRRAQSLGIALLTHLAEHGLVAAPAEQVPSLPSPRLRSVLDFVASHLDRPLSLDRLAAVAGMDLFRFARAFKQTTGSSPHRYVLEARIAQAKVLLRDRSLSITEVALRTGFATPSHFSVTFRRITSLSPRDFRDGVG